MPFFDGHELISYALDAEYEEKIYWRWVIGYQFIIEYDEFKKNLNNNRQRVSDDRTAAEILREVKDITG